MVHNIIHVGKRRKAAANSSSPAPNEYGAADDDNGEDAEAELVEEEAETPESWTSIAAGLAELCVGLAAAVDSEEIAEEQISEHFEEDSLLLMESVLRMVVSLPSMPASAAVRAHLFSELAGGRLMQQHPTEGEPLTTRLSSAIHCLCSSATSGTKVVAMLLRALGLRQQTVIRMPVAADERTLKGKGHKKSRKSAVEDEENDDGTCCDACGAAQPEDNLLLCDGCDNAYHTTCMKPALSAVPEGDWFCHVCETDMQSCVMGKVDGITCLGILLSGAAGRDLLCSHGHLESLLKGLGGQAHEQEQLLLAQIQAPTPAVGATKEPKRGSANAKKAAAKSAELDMQGPTAQGPCTVSLYCRTALHLALTSILSNHVDGNEDEGVEAVTAAKQATLEGAMMALNEAVEMCEQVLDACLQSSADCSILEHGLDFVAAVLQVMCDAQHLNVLQLRNSQSQVSRTCLLGDKVVEAAIQVVGTANGNAAPKSTLDSVSCVLTLIKQLCIGVCKSQASLTEGQALTERSDASKLGTGQPKELEPVLAGITDTPSSLWSILDSQFSQLMLKLLSPKASTLLSCLKPQLMPLITVLLSSEAKPPSPPPPPPPANWALPLHTCSLMPLITVLLSSEAKAMSPSCEWLKALVRVMGTAFAQCSDQDWAMHTKADDLEAADAPDGVEKATEDDTENQNPNRDQSDKVTRSRNQKSHPQVPPACTLLSDVEPSAALMGGVVMGAVSRCKRQDAMFDALVGAASEGWEQLKSRPADEDGFEMSLGAVSMMAMMNVQDICSQQLRMSGSASSGLIKLEMMLQELQVADTDNIESDTRDKHKHLSRAIERIIC
eukprot:gene16055-22192_t